MNMWARSAMAFGAWLCLAVGTSAAGETAYPFRTTQALSGVDYIDIQNPAAPTQILFHGAGGSTLPGTWWQGWQGEDDAALVLWPDGRAAYVEQLATQQPSGSPLDLTGLGMDPPPAIRVLTGIWKPGGTNFPEQGELLLNGDIEGAPAAKDPETRPDSILLADKTAPPEWLCPDEPLTQLLTSAFVGQHDTSVWRCMGPAHLSSSPSDESAVYVQTVGMGPSAFPSLSRFVFKDETVVKAEAFRFQAGNGHLCESNGPNFQIWPFLLVRGPEGDGQMLIYPAESAKTSHRLLAGPFHGEELADSWWSKSKDSLILLSSARWAVFLDAAINPGGEPQLKVQCGFWLGWDSWGNGTGIIGLQE